MMGRNLIFAGDIVLLEDLLIRNVSLTFSSWLGLKDRIINNDPHILILNRISERIPRGLPRC